MKYERPTLYPKVRTLGHREIENIFFNGPVTVQEKVDGSNFTFGRTVDGDLFIASRSQWMDPMQPEKMFVPAVEYLWGIKERIPAGYCFRAEYLQKPKHNVLAYSRIPTNHLVLFEVEIQDRVTGLWTNYAQNFPMLGYWSGVLDIDLIPHITESLVCVSPQAFIQWVKDEGVFDRLSYLGGTKIEGVVVKNSNAFHKDWGHILVGKLVREEFKEQHQHIKKGERDDPVAAIGHRLGGPARWQKAVQRLTEEGKLVGGPEDIPALLARVGQDVKEECVEEIKEALYKQFKGQVFKGSCKGLPEWYKEQLLVQPGGGRIDNDIDQLGLEG